LNLLSFLFFVFLAFAVVHGRTTQIDTSFLRGISILRAESLTSIMLAVSFVFHPVVLIGISGVLFVFLLLIRKKHLSLFFFSTMVVSILSGLVLKTVFGVVRPLNSIAIETGASFPSNHAVGAMVFFMTLLYVVLKEVRDRTIRFLFGIVAIFMVIISGFSRLYLGVHWLSDVLASFALGLFWVTLAILILKKYQEKVEV
jgi:undecaprenyl-diphosphatase